MFISTYSPEDVEVYFFGNKFDRASGFYEGQFYEISDESIKIKFHILAEFVKKLDRKIGQQIPVRIKIPIVREGCTEVFEYTVNGVLSRKIVGGTLLPYFEYKFAGKVEKV